MKKMISVVIYIAILLVLSLSASANILSQNSKEQRIEGEGNSEITITNKNFSPLAKKFYRIYCGELIKLVANSDKEKIKGKWSILIQENLSLKPMFTTVWIMIFEQKNTEDPHAVGVVYIKNTDFDPAPFALEAAKKTIESLEYHWLWFKKPGDGWTIGDP